MSPAELVNREGFAAILGVSRQRVDVLAAREDFPVPAATVNGRPLWDAAVAREYAAQRRSVPDDNGRDTP